MTQSLKGRMLWALALWIVFAWSVALLAVFLFSRNSQTSIWDERLQSIAIKLLAMTPAREEGESAAKLQPQPGAVPINKELEFQVWNGADRLIASTPDAPTAPLKPDFLDGFGSVSIDGEVWRVYSASDRTGRHHVQVGSPRAMINADFRKHSLRAVTMAAVPLALAGGLMWWAIRRALRPLAAIETAARTRSRFDLSPLPTADVPTELRSLVSSFNDLLLQLDDAIQSERRFIGDAAHELRTPLAALQAQASVALTAKSEEDAQRALQKLVTGAERTSRLAEQLLDMARLDAGHGSPARDRHDLSEIVRHVVSEFEVAALRAHRSIELAVEPCMVACDVNEMGILVRNLVDNSLRYTAANGRVRVSCGYEDGSESASVVLEVADDGPGVPVEERDAIFKRFHRGSTGSIVRGSGIGLSLVARIAERHNARIETGVGLSGVGLAVRLLFPAAMSASG